VNRREAPLPYEVDPATCLRAFHENPEADAADFPGVSSVLQRQLYRKLILYILVFLPLQPFEGSIPALNLLRTSLPELIIVYGQDCTSVHVHVRMQIHRNWMHVSDQFTFLGAVPLPWV
jgi:hypothetical protein